MPLTVTYTVGAAPFAKNYNIANAKVKAIFQRSAFFQGIDYTNMTDEQLVQALIQKDMERHVAMSKEVQKMQLEQANQAAIDAALAADNTLS